MKTKTLKIQVTAEDIEKSVRGNISRCVGATVLKKYIRKNVSCSWGIDFGYIGINDISYPIKGDSKFTEYIKDFEDKKEIVPKDFMLEIIDDFNDNKIFNGFKEGALE